MRRSNTVSFSFKTANRDRQDISAKRKPNFWNDSMLWWFHTPHTDQCHTLINRTQLNSPNEFRKSVMRLILAVITSIYSRFAQSWWICFCIASLWTPAILDVLLFIVIDVDLYFDECPMKTNFMNQLWNVIDGSLVMCSFCGVYMMVVWMRGEMGSFLWNSPQIWTQGEVFDCQQGDSGRITLNFYCFSGNSQITHHTIALSTYT